MNQCDDDDLACKIEALNYYIQRFAMSEFSTLKKAFDYYLYGFCTEFAEGFNSILISMNQSSRIVSLWGYTPGIDDPVWFHDCVLFEGLYWDISGSHTEEEIKKHWSKDFLKIEIRDGSGITSRDADFSETELKNIKSKFFKYIFSV